MPLYSTQQKFTGEQKTRLMTVVTGGGTVLVEALHNASPETWVAATTITEDGVYEVNFDVLGIRCTPSGGATYSLQVRA